MHDFNIKTTLQRMQDILISHQSKDSDWLSSLISLCETDEVKLYEELNSKHMWGGAGSIANEALADNPGIENWIWQAEIQEYRELMIELGHHLMQRENAYPDISSWLLAFNNWNQSNI